MPEATDNRGLTVYGSKTCEDTERTEERLGELGIDYRFVDIDHDMEANELVSRWNNGRAKTPTVVFGAGEQPRLVEPSNDELDEMLRERGLLSSD